MVSERDYYQLKLESIELENKTNCKDKQVNTILTLEDLTSIELKLIEQQDTLSIIT